MNYYYRHIGDYLRDTSHLSLLEHGIYTRLLDVYYTLERPLDGQGVGRRIGVRTDQELEALMTVLGEFFIQDGELYTQARCDREITSYHDKADKAKASANKRWANTDRIATAMPTHSEGNAPNNQEPIAKKEKRQARTRAPQISIPDGFAISERVRTWADAKGLNHLDLQFEAFVSYAKRKGATYADWDEALMTAIRDDWAKARGKPVDDVFQGAI